MSLTQTASAWAPRVLSILRIMTGLLFLVHGTMKFFNFPANDYFANLEAFSLIGFAGALELVGGVLIILGLFTRPVAFILSGEMAFAYFIGHAGGSFFPVMNGGESAVLFCFIFLYLACAGGGVWSIDAKRGQA